MTEPDADCVFCKIVAREIPAPLLAETDRVVAFRDVNPQAPTHVLVVPRDHITHAGVIGPEHGATVADLFVAAQQVAAAEGLTDRGYRLVFNVGDDSGNSVPHLHLHVLGGRQMGWPPWAG